MSSPVVFAITRAQAKCLDAITRLGFENYTYHVELAALKRRAIVRETTRAHRLTAVGHIVQELVRELKLHVDTPGVGALYQRLRRAP